MKRGAAYDAFHAAWAAFVHAQHGEAGRATRRWAGGSFQAQNKPEIETQEGARHELIC